MTTLQTPFGPAADLSKDIDRDRKAQERMTAFQMLLEAHSRDAVSVLKGATLGNLHDHTEKWRKYIFDGVAISSKSDG